MKPSSELTATLVQVAHLYYEANKSQQQIADQLGVSRSLIALYLKKARELNIVRIEIIDPQDNCEDLALSLQEKTGLKKIIVVPTATNPELTRRSLGGAVARFLETRLQDRDLIGLGWGRTIMEVVGLLAPSRPRQIEVVPLLGESGYTGSYTQMNQIVLQMANSFNGQPYFLLAPLLVGTRELQDALLKDATISEVVERWNHLTMACVGIGALPPVPGQVLYLGEDNVGCYRDAGAVGDICARHFDRTGRQVSTELDERLIGINLSQLKAVETVIAVAGGVEKAWAVSGAVWTSLITDLFIDEELAIAVLDMIR